MSEEEEDESKNPPTGAAAKWSCAACTFQNSGARNACEICNNARPPPAQPSRGQVGFGDHLAQIAEMRKDLPGARRSRIEELNQLINEKRRSLYLKDEEEISQIEIAIAAAQQELRAEEAAGGGGGGGGMRQYPYGAGTGEGAGDWESGGNTDQQVNTIGDIETAWNALATTRREKMGQTTTVRRRLIARLHKSPPEDNPEATKDKLLKLAGDNDELTKLINAIFGPAPEPAASAAAEDPELHAPFELKF